MRAMLTAPCDAPQNIDRQLTALLAFESSPVDKWAGRARASQKEDDELQTNAMLGGRQAGPPPGRGAGARGGAAGSLDALHQVTPAERKIDLEAGVGGPGAATPADAGPEFKDRLRSTLASFSRPRAEPPGAQPSDASPLPGDPEAPAGPGNGGKAE